MDEHKVALSNLGTVGTDELLTQRDVLYDKFNNLLGINSSEPLDHLLEIERELTLREDV